MKRSFRLKKTMRLNCKCRNVSIVLAPMKYEDQKTQQPLEIDGIELMPARELVDIKIVHAELADIRSDQEPLCLYCQQKLFYRLSENDKMIYPIKCLYNNGTIGIAVSPLFGISLPALTSNQQPSDLTRITAYLKQYGSNLVQTRRQTVKEEIASFEQQKFRELSSFTDKVHEEFAHFQHLLPSEFASEADKVEIRQKNVRYESEIFDQYRDTMDLMLDEQTIKHTDAEDPPEQEFNEKFAEPAIEDSSHLMGTSVPISIPHPLSYKPEPAIVDDTDNFIAPHILGPQTYKQLNPMATIFGDKPTTGNIVKPSINTIHE